VDGESAPQKHRGLKGPWKPGQSGNPTGRVKGCRNKLGEAFVEKLYDDFKEHGVAAIEMVRVEKPDAYLKVIASILPKELKIERVDELSDDELDQRIRQLASVIGIEIGIPNAVGGEEETVRH
jgi:hypothetical protein